MTDQPTGTTEPAAPEGTVDAPQIDADEPESFSREYVSQIRQEAAERRKAAAEATQRADDLSRQLFLAKVSATGKLADPNDLPYSPDLVGDDDAINAAIDATLAAHPHYASRRPVPGTSIGQGAQGSPVAPPPSLIDAIRAKQGR
jgi:hypothetical protein